MGNSIGKYLSLITFIFWGIACNDCPDKSAAGKESEDHTTRFFSKVVADSFSISIKLPNDYSPENQYPVVYLLDANLYFDIIGTTINKYHEIGLAPAVILVGIGYKDFSEMDSLRNRDDTFPTALPEYEMNVSGGADKFLNFIDTELIPYIDKEYKTDRKRRILMGHSLGGYFTAYALLHNLLGKRDNFSGYIAASPSVHYNNYYLLEQYKNIAQQAKRVVKTNAYFTFGGLEDKEDEDDSTEANVGEVAAKLDTVLAVKQVNALNYKSDVFSNLGHMETPIPTFIKGLQWTLENNK